MLWLLDKYIKEINAEEARVLCSAIEATGDTYEFTDRESVRKDAAQSKFKEKQPVLSYGSIEFVRSVNPVFYPGKWCDWASLSCQNYYAHIGALLFNQRYTMLPAAEALRREEELLARYDGAFFIRPSRGDKPFSGIVIDYNNNAETAPAYFKRDMRLCDPSDLVVISPVQTIQGEWRCFMRHKWGVIASSRYKDRGEDAVSEGVPFGVLQMAEEAGDMLAKVIPDPIYSIDIAKDRHGEYSVLEVNSFSCSGFYACNAERLIEAAHHAAMEEWNEMKDLLNPAQEEGKNELG